MSNTVLGLIFLIVIIVCYMTRIVPVPMAAVLGSMAFAFPKINTYAQSFTGYGTEAMPIAIAGMGIALAFKETGFDKPFGEKILSIFQGNKNKMLIAMMVVSAVIGAYVSPIAGAAVFIPIVTAVAKASEGRIKAKFFVLPVTFAAVVGGSLTDNTITAAVRDLLAAENIAPIQMFTTAGPAVILLVLLAAYFLTIGSKLQEKVLSGMTDEHFGEEMPVEKIKTEKMKVAGILFLISIICILTKITTAAIFLLLGSCAMITVKCIPLKKSLYYTNFEAIVIMGANFGIATGISNSGAGKWIADYIIDMFGGAGASPFAMLAALCLAAIILGNVMHSPAVCAMLIPTGLSLAAAADVSPWPFIVGVILSASAAFALPIGPVAVAMSLYAGYKYTDYVLIGGLFSVICLIAIVAATPIFYPF